MKYAFPVFLIIVFLFFVCGCDSNKAPEQKAPLGFIEVDGAKLDYVIEGTGKPTLVLGSSVYYPKTFSEELRDHMQMHFVDLKWFAKDYTPQNLDSMDIQSIASDVEAAREGLGLEKPILIGHSIHGTIAMEYAKRYPDQLAALVIIGSPTQWGNDVYNGKATALWETASAERKAIQEENYGKYTELDRLTGQEEAVKSYNRMSPQYWYDPTYDASWLWGGMTVHSEVTQHLFTKVFAEYDMFSEAPELKFPVFVAMGIYDYVIPYTLWEPSYENIPDFTLSLFDHSGHTPQLEEEELFNQRLLEWLKTKEI